MKFIPVLFLLNATVHLLTRISVEKLCKISCFQSFKNMVYVYCICMSTVLIASTSCSCTSNAISDKTEL